MGEMNNSHKILVGKPEGAKPLERSRHGWEDDVRMNLRKIGLEGTDWIHLTQDKTLWQTFVNTVMNLWVPLNGRDFLN
jgi:hypothetical protein